MVFFPHTLIDIDSPSVDALTCLPNSADTIVSSVNSISESRLTVYGANNPRISFARVEALFIAREILSQVTKYAYLVGALPIEIAAEVRDLIDQVPENDPYEKIKAVVIQRTSVSDEKRLQQLLTSCELGDNRSSQLLRHMKQLANDLADMADKMMQIYPDSHGVNSVLSAGKEDKGSISNFQQQLAELTKQLASLQATIATIHSRPTRSSSRRDRFPDSYLSHLSGPPEFVGIIKNMVQMHGAPHNRAHPQQTTTDSGKRAYQTVMAATISGPIKIRLFHIRDHISGSGVEISIISL
ncbi:unnamed protein product [Schistosoma mattheei]|uniref:DUF7041 domain-containing protein n=1 Tax=Schistosoma mattheei TaxID=31246 RepID=A0A3P8GDU2_9TREM|nr:unnamed protein product [Schistosoma mattheei]